MKSIRKKKRNKDRRTANIIFLFSVFVCIALMMHACATTELRHVWKDKSYQGGMFKKILIIDTDTSSETKRFMEDEFSDQLQSRGVEGMQSHTIFPEDTILEKKTITAKIKELGLDSIIIINQTDVQKAGTITYYGVSYIEDFYSYYRKCCYQVSSGYNIAIETKLFDAKYDHLIWASISNTITSSGTFQEDVKSYFQEVILNLAGNKLIN